MNFCIWARSHPAATPDGTALLWLLSASGQTWAQAGQQSLYLDTHTAMWTHTAPFPSTHVPTKTSPTPHCHIWVVLPCLESGSHKEGMMVCSGRSRKPFPSQQGSKHPACNRGFTGHKSARKHGTDPCPTKCRGTGGPVRGNG